MAIAIADLQPTQAGLRNPLHMLQLAKGLEDGSRTIVVNDPKKRILVSKFEDNQIFVHNGHHRVCAKVLAGKDRLENDEFRLEDWTYEQYQEFNWDTGFLTPFDPKFDLRLADLSRFREAVRIVKEKNGADDAETFVRNHAWLYLTPRRLHSFGELAAISAAGLTSEPSSYWLPEQPNP